MSGRSPGGAPDRIRSGVRRRPVGAQRRAESRGRRRGRIAAWSPGEVEGGRRDELAGPSVLVARSLGGVGEGRFGPPVVFCHGTPWSSALWRPFADVLSRDYTVYLWDMPGYGLSSKEPGHPVDLDVQGQLLADLLTTWGLDAPHVVAHDFGGAVSLRAHLLHGSPVASLLLVDVVALRPWGSPFFNLVKDHPDVSLDYRKPSMQERCGPTSPARAIVV